MSKHKKLHYKNGVKKVSKLNRVSENVDSTDFLKAETVLLRISAFFAAATWAELEVGCAMPMDIPERIEVPLERPFIYAVMNVETGLPVFTGIYNYGSKIDV